MPTPTPATTDVAPRSRHRATTLSRTSRQWWLIAHLAAQCWYLAGVLGALALLLITMNAQPGDRIQAHHFAGVLDWILIIPGTHLVLITGLVLALGTRYTLSGYRWIVVKLVANIALITFGGTFIRQWAHTRAVSQARATHDFAVVGTQAYASDVRAFAIALLITLATLIAIIAISVIKPWGRTGPRGKLIVSATIGWLIGIDASFAVARGPYWMPAQLSFALSGSLLGLGIALVARRTPWRPRNAARRS